MDRCWGQVVGVEGGVEGVVGRCRVEVGYGGRGGEVGVRPANQVYSNVDIPRRWLMKRVNLQRFFFA